MSQRLAQAWSRQTQYCDAHGSPFTARVLDAAWADWQQGGALRELLPDWAGNAWIDAVALRVAGALHALVLEGSDAALAALYPPAVASFDALRGPPAVRDALRQHRQRVADALRRPPQTNEVGRSAVLLGGFAALARETGLPLATLEIGASAGLNQLWHRYRYELGAATWGDAASPVLIRSDWRGAAPALPPRIDVASCSGCDVAPIDLREPGAAMRLASYVWPDQHERLARLRAAIGLAAQRGVAVEAADAAQWAARELGFTRSGQATVLYHSIVWQYLPATTQAALQATLAAAGARATRKAPLAWLAFELADPMSPPQLTLTLWPGGQPRVLASAHAHGQQVDWCL